MDDGLDAVPLASELSSVFLTENDDQDEDRSSSSVSGCTGDTKPQMIISGHSFPWKLHDMLEDAEKNGFKEIVSWELDGMAFKVHDYGEFFDKVMPWYFDQSKYESFRRQLNLYGFSRISQGQEYGDIHLHKSFVKGKKSLCQFITRRNAKEQR